MFRQGLKFLLSDLDEGLRFSEAGNCKAALLLLEKATINLILLDLNMPGMKGDELMRTIRAEFPQTEIIIITGCGSIETAVEGIRHGVFDYLTKPFGRDELLEALARQLRRTGEHG